MLPVRLLAENALSLSVGAKRADLNTAATKVACYP